MSMQKVVERFLREEQLAFDEKDGVLRVRGVAEDDAFVAIVRVVEEDFHVAVFAVSTLAVPAEKRAVVMELLTRIHFGLRTGCFELDLDDGELRFRTSLDVEGTQLGAPLVKNLFYGAVATMQRYLPAIADVIGGASIPETLQRIEG